MVSFAVQRITRDDLHFCSLSHFCCVVLVHVFSFAAAGPHAAAAAVSTAAAEPHAAAAAAGTAAGNTSQPITWNIQNVSSYQPSPNAGKSSGSLPTSY